MCDPYNEITAPLFCCDCVQCRNHRRKKKKYVMLMSTGTLFVQCRHPDAIKFAPIPFWMVEEAINGILFRFSFTLFALKVLVQFFYEKQAKITVEKDGHM